MRLLRRWAQLTSLYIQGQEAVPWHYRAADGTEKPSMLRHPQNQHRNITAKEKCVSMVLQDGVLSEMRARLLTRILAESWPQPCLQYSSGTPRRGPSDGSGSLEGLRSVQSGSPVRLGVTLASVPHTGRSLGGVPFAQPD